MQQITYKIEGPTIMQSIHYGRLLPVSFQPQFVNPLREVEVWAANGKRVQLKFMRIAVNLGLIAFGEPFRKCLPAYKLNNRVFRNAGDLSRFLSISQM